MESSNNEHAGDGPKDEVTEISGVPDDGFGADAAGVSSDESTVQSEQDAADAKDAAAEQEAPAATKSDWDAWRAEVTRVGGRSPLTHFIDTTATRIELSTTHPGGLAQFITGRPTALSSLIRDDLALRAARQAASAIASKGIELASARSIDAVHLGIGLASFPHGDGTVHGPVLLRPLIIRRKGRDFELQLSGRPFVNPELAHELRSTHGVILDDAHLVDLVDNNGTFAPNAVLDALRLAAAHVPGFAVEPRLVVSTFADVARAMAADLERIAHPVLDAAAGDDAALWNLRENLCDADVIASDERQPQGNRLVLDADEEQETIVAEALAGNSIVVDARPGTGATQTIVNLLAALVADDRRVLVVSPRRATTAGIVERLRAVGLQGLAVSEGSLRSDIIASISRSEQAKRPDTAEIDDALVRLRKVLLDYRGALRHVDDDLGVSVLDCLRELSRLAMLDDAPQTQARLGRGSVLALTNSRPRAVRTMVEAARLGQFKYGASDTPWYNADFESEGAAQQAYDGAVQLVDGELDALVAEAQSVLGETKLREYTTLTEMGTQIELLSNIRDTLDSFVPAVFDRSVSELITATGPRRDAIAALGNLQRRRLRKHANEFVRPGAHVPNMHEALIDVQRQRKLWGAYAPDGAVPKVPGGLAGLATRYHEVAMKLSHIDAALPSDERGLCVDMQLDDLRALLTALAAPSDALSNIRERAQLMAGLAELDLDPLVTDLADREVAEDRIENELELAWWQSALELLLESERALLRGNTSVLGRLEADYALVDEAHIGATSERLAWQLAEQWRLAIRDWPDEASALRELVRGRGVTSEALTARASHLLRSLAPVWLASPYDVHRIAKALPFDCVIVTDAGALTLAETAGAIARAKQVIAIGDGVTQAPAPFDTGISTLGVRPSEQLANPGELRDESALARLSQVLPNLTLNRSYRTGGRDLVDAVNDRFYDGQIVSLPWAGTFLGHPSITVQQVSDAWGMPVAGAAAIESPEAEVARVVQLVTQHARSRPNESLMVVTGNERHEVRVQQAIVQELGQNPALTEFVGADSAEPFVVADLSHAMALSRDRVIFSIGYGHSQYSKNVDFGPMGEPGGERLVAIAMTRARRSMTIIASFDAASLDPATTQHGAEALREILLEAGRPTHERYETDGDPLMVDLAERLRHKGLRAEVNYAGMLPLVVANGGVCAAIEADHDGAPGSLRDALRIRPEMLRAHGWHTMRVHAFELFTDPEAVAERIAELVGADASQP